MFDNILINRREIFEFDIIHKDSSEGKLEATFTEVVFSPLLFP